MKKKWKVISTHWLAIWLVVAIIGMVSFISYAEYIEDKNRVKRVAANMTNEGQPFSSNYLMDDNTPVTTEYFPADTENWCVINVKIWNYNHKNSVKAYQGTLGYTLKAQLVNSSGTPIANGTLGTYRIGVRQYAEDAGDDVGYTYFSGYDETNGYYIQNAYEFGSDGNGDYVPSEHMFQIRYSASMLVGNPGIYVKLTAVPDNLSELSSISALLSVAAQGSAISLGWEGSFDDDKVHVDYDGLNYVISGNGTATITFKWRPDRLEVNRYNLTDYGLNAQMDGNGWKYVQFEADSNTRNRYDFQLYMTDPTAADYVTVDDDFWKTAESFVTFSAE